MHDDDDGDDVGVDSHYDVTSAAPIAVPAFQLLSRVDICGTVKLTLNFCKIVKARSNLKTEVPYTSGNPGSLSALGTGASASHSLHVLSNINIFRLLFVPSTTPH